MEPQDSGKGGGPQKKSMEGRKGRLKEGSPSIKLGLGIGDDSAHQNPIITQQHRKKKCVAFTAAQLHELQQQSLIFNYMAARLPVPLHLVIPVWTSVASSFGSENGGIYKQYPSFIGFCPEAERCRRTDGKKWRCSKNVVPDQKYCERHMHRGRKRSRKLVEASEIAPPCDTTPPNNSNKYSESTKTIPTPASFHPMTPISSNTSASHRTSTTTTIIGSDNDGIGNNPSPISTTPTAIAANTTTSTLTMSTSSTTPTTINFSTTTTTTTTPTPTPTNDDSGNKTNHNLDGKAVNQSSKSRSNMNIRGNISPGLDFSPKSVLQVQDCSGSCFYRSEMELEPGRCRRTDGKKWRCSRDVVPEKKYCAQHMHRGAKKHVEASQLAAVLSAARRPHTKTVPNEANYATPNTNLSISIPASPPQLMTNDEKSTNSSGSDTTITDTTITAYEIGNFSS